MNVRVKIGYWLLIVIFIRVFDRMIAWAGKPRSFTAWVERCCFNFPSDERRTASNEIERANLVFDRMKGMHVK
jgi:hypothetical protein